MLEGELISQCLVECRLNQVFLLPEFSSISFFILKNSPVLNDYKHTHNMMQPLLCLKIWRVGLHNVLYWICPKHKTSYSGQNFCSCTLMPSCKQDACFVIFSFCTGFLFTLSIRLVLWSNYNVVDPSSVFSFHSH